MEDANAARDAKLHELEQVDKDIILILSAAASCLTELGKEKTAMKSAETQAQTFLKTLEKVDGVLAQKISHLGQISSGGSHEGTHYDSMKEREIIMRCSLDMEDNLAFLAQERSKYLAMVASENAVVADLDDPMESPERPPS
ncbi:hypothetical protein BV898_07951 [Hypsibius exemplaris]|uniref:Mediator of RNA polymerase II transcription subunit 11 n=1 Tax=Hypsibius exemplaris TaxID=2072580 RepID=A0A1W0WS42_HYPEX|nr:hypothetical protein BV898_07951 [Hypsibius exemplaris]